MENNHENLRNGNLNSEINNNGSNTDQEEPHNPLQEDRDRQRAIEEVGRELARIGDVCQRMYSHDVSRRGNICEQSRGANSSRGSL